MPTNEIPDNSPYPFPEFPGMGSPYPHNFDRRIPAPKRIDRVVLPFGSCLLAGGAEETIEAHTLIMCKPMQLCISHDIAHKVDVRSIIQGQYSMFGNLGVMKGTSFCERRVIRKGERPIDWRTMHPGMTVRLKLFNRTKKAIRLYAYFVVIEVR